MKSETLVQQHPPTPPIASADLQSSLHQVAQYNADGQYPYNDAQSYGVAYGSQERVMQDGIPRHPSQIGGHPDETFGLGIQYVRGAHSLAKVG